MRAIVYLKYGSPEVLKLQEVKKPLPSENEVLVRVYAASVTAADVMMRKGRPYFGRLFIGLFKPKNPITGTGFAGVIEAVGTSVKQFKIGDKVFGESIFGQGTNAEYVCVAENGIITTKPGNLTFEEAAPVCDGALTSLNFLREVANIKPGQNVLVNGASGSLGTAAVQIAKYHGAIVTAVSSSSNLEMVKLLGADNVIDYTKHDFTKNRQAYDIIYDTVGKSSFLKSKGALTEYGVYVSPVLELTLLGQMIRTSLFGKKKARFSATGTLPFSELRKLLEELKQIIESNHLKMVVDRDYPLEQTAEAHNYVEKGHKKGNVIVTIH